MKSWTFAKLLVKKCKDHPGTRFICVREIQNSLKESVKKLVEDQIKLAGLGHLFHSTQADIRTPGGGVIIFIGMQNHTSESVKSLEGFDGVWVEEAQTLSKRSLELLRPTIRKEGSELWFSWNPRHKSDPVDEMFRGPAGPPPDSIVIEVNFHDNPNFPAVLSRDMEYDLRRDPDKYAHVWLGGYETHSEASVFRNWRV
jgi:phage terminase large subunit